MTDTATGIPIPELSSSPDVPGDMLAAFTAIEPGTVPPFATTTERDVAFGLAAFLQCTVGEVTYKRRAGAWHVVYDTDGGPAWVTPSFQTGWNVLGVHPVKYRVMNQRVWFKGSCYFSGGVPGTGGMLTLPAACIPAGAGSWENFSHMVPTYASSRNSGPTITPAALSLRNTGSLVCYLQGSTSSGVEVLHMDNVGWDLT